ncbi:MAG: type II toxin-antitoxin system RelE/ParE family toxin [Planctomycetota bacterium]
MIRTFRDKETARLFRRERVKKFPLPVQRAVLRKLLLIDAAESLHDLRVPPGNRLEKLRGDREGQYSIRINDQWRVCFRWEDADAYDVEIMDYH